MKKILVVMVGLILLSTSVVSAQTPAEQLCQGDFNFNLSVGAEDVSTFLGSFGRNPFNNPCPLHARAMPQATGQTVSIAPFDDGWYHSGIVDPDIPDNSIDRFTNNGDGTVTDNLTGLIWLEWASCGGQMSWTNALNYVSEIENGSDCGNPGTWELTDGSSPGDWRLPNVREMESLINYAYKNPAMGNTDGKLQHSSGDPFWAVQNDKYWTSSYDAGAPGTSAWVLDMGTGASSPVSTPTLPLPPPTNMASEGWDSRPMRIFSKNNATIFAGHTTYRLQKTAMDRRQ